MKIVIIDGQGGRMGSLLIEKLKASALFTEASVKEGGDIALLAIGTNSIATAAMLRAGADAGATGENPVLVNCRDADIIAGPIGILAADSLLGEITPAMAAAIGQSRAEKVLLPVNKCCHHVVGVRDLPLQELIAEAADMIVRLYREHDCKAFH